MAFFQTPQEEQMDYQNDQAQQPLIPGPLIPPQYRIDDKWQYNLQEELKKFEDFLRSRAIDPKTGEYVSIGQPLMNNEGVNRLMSKLSSFLHKGVLLCNLSKEDVYRMTEEHMDSLIDWVYLTWHENGLRPNDFRHIITQMDALIYTTLTHARDDMERKHRSQMTSINETRVFNDQNKKRWGIFG